MGTGVHFDTGDRTAMTMLAAHSDDFRGAWEGHRASITAGAAAVGAGPLAEAFMSRYRATESAVLPSAEALPQICRHLAEVGHACADDYLAVDRRAAAGFPAAG